MVKCPDPYMGKDQPNAPPNPLKGMYEYYRSTHPILKSYQHTVSTHSIYPFNALPPHLFALLAPP